MPAANPLFDPAENAKYGVDATAALKNVDIDELQAAADAATAREDAAFEALVVEKEQSGRIARGASFLTAKFALQSDARFKAAKRRADALYKAFVARRRREEEEEEEARAAGAAAAAAAAREAEAEEEAEEDRQFARVVEAAALAVGIIHRSSDQMVLAAKKRRAAREEEIELATALFEPEEIPCEYDATFTDDEDDDDDAPDAKRPRVDEGQDESESVNLA
jgi:hypothetical protein